jgi:hypothetical protein
MKALKVIVTGIVLLLACAMQAQVSVNVKIGSPPPWGPVGYTDVRYYYLPDVEAYYDIQSSMFIYYGGKGWVHRAHLPSQYRNYDLYGGYKVVMTNYRGNDPYTYFKEHKMKYAKGYHGEAQRTFGERPGKGNSGAKNSHKGDHDNKGGSHGNEKSNGHGNDKGDSHGHDKNMKEDHGNGGGNGKKK